MPEIVVTIRDKVAEASVRSIVCDNTDYTVRLDCDAQWGEGPKIVYFVLQGVGALAPATTADDVCAVPPIRLSDGVGRQLAIGVQQGSVKTSTAANVFCWPSAEDELIRGIHDDDEVSQTWLEWVNAQMAEMPEILAAAEGAEEAAAGAVAGVAELKSLNGWGAELSGWSENHLYYKTDGALTAGAQIDLENPSTATSNVRCLAVPCIPGDSFLVFCAGKSGSRAWAFLDADRRVISRAEANVTCDWKILIAPKNAAWLTLNDTRLTGRVFGGVYGDLTAAISGEWEAQRVFFGNFDAIRTGGFYFVRQQDRANVSGLPDAADGSLFVVVLTSNAVTAQAYARQICFAADGKVWIRTWFDGVWTVWASDGADSGLPELALTGDTTGISKENAVDMVFAFKNAASKTVVASGDCTLKWQGSSSLRYAKKNYTIKFSGATDPIDGWLAWITSVNTYRRNLTHGEYTAPMPTENPRYGGAETWWGEQKKFCLKANFVDPSHARNIVSARLWAEMVKARVAAGEITDGRADAPCYGAIDGFPIVLTVNGSFAGLYTFNIPKDKWTFSMTEAPGEYVVAGEENANAATQWRAEAQTDPEAADYGRDYEVEVGDDAAAALGSLNTAIRAAIAAGADWEETLAPYVDIDSVFDYFIFTCCISNHDALARNILYGSYDGTRWFMTAYDMDTTYGENPYGTDIFGVKTARTQFAEAATMHRLAELIWTYSRDRLAARYTLWRRGGTLGGAEVPAILSDAHVAEAFRAFVQNIPSRMYAKDRETWPGLPGTATAEVGRYADYYAAHCALLDEEIAGYADGGSKADAILAATEETTFDDGGDNLPMASLVIGFGLAQAGSGDPGEGNVRPISPVRRTAVTVSPTGTAADGRTVTVPLQPASGAVYGGTLDVVTGELTADTAYIQFTGAADEAWNIANPAAGVEGYRYFWLQLGEQGSGVNGSGVCSHLPAVTIAQASEDIGQYVVNSSARHICMVSVRPSGYATMSNISLFKAWLAAQAQNGTPVQLAWELTEPVSFGRLNPVQIRTFLGENHVSADTGDVRRIVYRADTGLYINGKLAALAAQIGNA